MKSIYTTIYICMFMTMKAIAQTDASTNTLSLRLQHIVEIASYTGRGDIENLQSALHSGLDDGLTINEIREVLTHTYAYCGFPRCLRSLQTFITVLDERKSQGIEDLTGKDASPVNDERTRYKRGCDILSEISGIPADTPKAAYAEFAPVIERFLKEHLFADLFERDILTYAERELTTVSVIAALGKEVEPMLHSHINICLNLGFTQEQMQQVIDIVEQNSKHDSANHMFPKGDLMVNNPNFTGKAWLKMLITENDSVDCTVGNVTFAPGVHNNWHSHPGGQILLCISGEGRYQEKGKPIQALYPGDVVKIAPNVVHWHGAAPESEFTHIAIGTQQTKGKTMWQGALKDEKY